MRHGGAPTAGQFAIDAPFPGRISRSLEQAAGWVVAAVLLVGGTSLVLAGSLFTAKMQFVSPESFTFMESVLIICMVILGGLGSIPGVVLGALILIILPEMLRVVQLYRMLALGSGLVLLMIFRPQGLLGGKGVSLRGLRVIKIFRGHKGY